LQASITELLDDGKAAEIKTHISSVSLQRIKACESFLAVRWLGILPKSDDFFIPNVAMVVALRHRLGLPYFDNLPAQCFCCFSPLTPDHFHCCSKMHKTAMNERHDYIKYKLESLCRPFGYVEDEPHVPGCNLIADACIDTFAGSHYIDVSFVHRTAPSYRNRNGMRARVAKKVRDYEEKVKAAHAKFVPFVLGSYGEMHNRALKFFTEIAGAAVLSGLYQDKQEFVRHACDVMAVAIQRATSLLALRGLRQQRTAVRSASLPR
jgi:hypothetical protein